MGIILFTILYCTGVVCSLAVLSKFAEDFSTKHETMLFVLCMFFPALIALSFLFAPIIYVLRSVSDGMDKR